MIQSLLNIAWPPVCEGCEDTYFEGDIPNLCQICHNERLFPLEAPYCEVCGQEYPGKMPAGFRCSNCRDRDIGFDFALGAYQAEGIVMDWIYQFKYGSKIHFARMFGKLMTRVWQDPRMAAEDDWLVVPVPLHRKRLRERGFNQAREIAREWIRQSPGEKNLKMIDALRRERYNTRQATLNRRQRLSNLQGAFSVTKHALKKYSENKNIVIVDDVLTTGTTGSECATILRDAISPNKITVITVLRG